MTDYYKHIYSQRDVDLIRGDLMARIATLTAERDALRGQVRELVEAVEKYRNQQKFVDELRPGSFLHDKGGDQLEELADTLDTLAAQIKEQDDD